MRAADLSLSELLEMDPEQGVLRLAGQRALLLDARALGLLRVELIRTLGEAAARGILTRFGFAHGWGAAEALRDALPWDSEREWRLAGARLHALQGMVRVQPPPKQRRPAGERRDETEPYADAIWKDSYEAEQHLQLLGKSEECVCWTLTGFASGYMSCVAGTRILCREISCRGRGDAVCRVVGKPEAEWGDEGRAALAFYGEPCLTSALATLTGELKQAERKLRVTRRALGLAGAALEDPSGIVAHSEAMRDVLALARRAAAVDATVLITGESGVGKERIARLIHEESPRAAGPFLAVNCGAISEGLLESELFGHARGSFTGATQDHAGLFEAAAGGTLLLDEVGELPLPMQAKLLRVLQEGEVRRVGETRSRKLDVRVVAATNRALEEEVEARRFRKDLYYRLRVIGLHLPPLRERKEDVLPLARTLLAAAAARLGRKSAQLSPAAADQLLRHGWPGNVRELGNAMERAVALGSGARIEPADLPEEIRAAPPAAGAASAATLVELERAAILSALERHRGNRERAAAQLGIGPATLYRKLSQYRVEAAATAVRPPSLGKSGPPRRRQPGLAS